MVPVAVAMAAPKGLRLEPATPRRLHELLARRAVDDGPPVDGAPRLVLGRERRHGARRGVVLVVGHGEKVLLVDIRHHVGSRSI